MNRRDQVRLHSGFPDIASNLGTRRLASLNTYSSPLLMVRNTILAVDPDALSLRAATIPFIPGIVISATTTSGLRRCTSDTSDSPRQLAVPTSSKVPGLRRSISASRNSLLSSAKSMRGRIKLCLVPIKHALAFVALAFKGAVSKLMDRMTMRFKSAWLLGKS